MFSGRVDHRVSDNDSFFVRFNWGKFKLDAPQGQAACCLPTPAEAAARFDLGPFVAGIQNTRLTTHGAAFNYSRVMSPALRQRAANRLRARPCRSRSNRTSAPARPIRSASSGINVTEFTTGLPNINVPDLTGISGGPAFLPVNPKQFHWQIEDALVWLQGPSSGEVWISAGRSLSIPVHEHRHARHDQLRPQLHQQPGTNAGGSGIASLLTGYINNAARGFLLEPYTLRTQEHGALHPGRLQVQLAVHRSTPACATRSSRAETEEAQQDRQLRSREPAAYLCRRGWRQPIGATRKRDYGNFAPRLGLTYDLFGDASTILRTGFGITYFPEQPSASNMIGQQVPYTISQNVNFATNPTDFSHGAHDRRSVSADRAGEADHDRGPPGRESPRARAFIRERNAVCRTVASRG